MNILLYLSGLKRSRRLYGLRRYTNLLYYEPDTIQLKISNIDSVEIGGCKFNSSSQLNSLQRVGGNPWFLGIRSEDTVLDIGANIGAVAIPLARVAKRVIAVEPIFWTELKENCKLNGLDNVNILPVAVGDPSRALFRKISFSGKETLAPVMSFHQIKESCYKVDFLKMDGEGCEWDMSPKELEGIRELRIEFHIRRGREKECRRKFAEYIDWMNNNGYRNIVEHPHYGLDPYDKEDYMVRASLKEEQVNGSCRYSESN